MRRVVGLFISSTSFSCFSCQPVILFINFLLLNIWPCDLSAHIQYWAHNPLKSISGRTFGRLIAVCSWVGHVSVSRPGILTWCWPQIFGSHTFHIARRTAGSPFGEVCLVIYRCGMSHTPLQHRKMFALVTMYLYTRYTTGSQICWLLYSQLKWVTLDGIRLHIIILKILGYTVALLNIFTCLYCGVQKYKQCDNACHTIH